MERWTILRVLEWTKGHFEAKGFDSPRLDAELLIASALGLERVMLYARFDQPLGEDERAKIRGLVSRRAQGEPVAYLLGEKEFWSLPFEVTPAVLIPRPDSETLVEIGTRLMTDRERPTIVDVGTGSGCLAVALASELPSAQVFALDVSEEACAVARGNVEKNGVGDRVTVLQSDLLAALPEVEIDLLVANLPYIPSGDMQTLMPDVRLFEPHGALDGGPDGLDPFRRLLESRPKMASGGAALLEADPAQMSPLAAMLERSGFDQTKTHDDLAGRARVVMGTWP